MTRAVCIGECMLEIRPLGSDALARGFAGDAYNTAVYLKRSSPAVQVQFATGLGQDALSRGMQAAWRAEGVDDALVFTIPGKQPGLYLIETDSGGDRRFHYWRNDSAAKAWLRALNEHGGARLLEGADLVYLSGISLAILPPGDRLAALELMRALRGRVGQVAFDPNYRAALWASKAEARPVVEAAMACADIVLPSSEDLQLLFGLHEPGAQMQRLVELGVGEAALTIGPGRCLVRDGAVREVAGAQAHRVVDTSGAGDSFNGAYLAARLGGAAAEDAARAGLALSAQVVGQPGAIAPLAVTSEGR